MKTLSLALAALLLASGAQAQLYNPWQLVPKPAAPKTVPAEKVSDLHLLADSGKHVLIGSASNEAEFQEAVSFWSRILVPAGIKAGTPTLKNGLYTIPYSAPGGLVIRRYLGEPRQFAPKDEAALRFSLGAMESAIKARALPVLKSFVLLDFDFMLPTYAIYYLTPEQPRREDELQLRVLDRGVDHEFALFSALPGVVLADAPTSWIAVYTGPELSLSIKTGKTQAETEQKLKDRVAQLQSEGYRVLGSVLSADSTGFAGWIYFRL